MGLADMVNRGGDRGAVDRKKTQRVVNRSLKGNALFNRVNDQRIHNGLLRLFVM